MYLYVLSGGSFERMAFSEESRMYLYIISWLGGAYNALVGHSLYYLHSISIS
jgi:hypothetical protein